MTRQAILEMPAGPTLDALVAALLFLPKPEGLPNYKEDGRRAGPWQVRHVGAGVLAWQCAASFSTELNAAWQLVEKLTAQGWGHKHHVFSAAAEMPGWQWTFMRPGGPSSIAGAEGETAPLAICRAAILTLPTF